MDVDHPEVQENLRRIASKFTTNHAFRDDLFQEALFHFWSTQIRRPGQTQSWYLQSSQFHLLHYISSGRSVDSHKRRADVVELESLDSDEPYTVPSPPDPIDIIGLVSAREILSLLSPKLTPVQREVLYSLASGLTLREIGRRLNISHSQVINHRRSIALTLHKLQKNNSTVANGRSRASLGG